MQIRIDLVGQVFGKLTVIAEEKKRQGRGHVVWWCICACGNKVLVRGSDLRRGQTRSCGCYALARRTKHGGLTASYNLSQIWRNLHILV